MAVSILKATMRNNAMAHQRRNGDDNHLAVLSANDGKSNVTEHNLVRLAPVGENSQNVSGT